jgi:hypothetical protein
VEVEAGDYVGGGPIIEKLVPSAKESRRADSNCCPHLITSKPLPHS